jgi:hypothetical protein
MNDIFYLFRTRHVSNNLALAFIAISLTGDLLAHDTIVHFKMSDRAAFSSEHFLKFMEDQFGAEVWPTLQFQYDSHVKGAVSWIQEGSWREDDGGKQGIGSTSTAGNRALGPHLNGKQGIGSTSKHSTIYGWCAQAVCGRPFRPWPAAPSAECGEGVP